MLSRSPQLDGPPRCRRERREENCWSGPPGGWRQLSSGTTPRLFRCFEGLRNAWGRTILWGIINWNFVFQLTAPGCCQLHPRNLLQDVHPDILPISSDRFLWQQRQASLRALWRGIAWNLRSNIWWKILFLHLVLSEWKVEVTSASSIRPSISSLSPVFRLLWCSRQKLRYRLNNEKVICKYAQEKLIMMEVQTYSDENVVRPSLLLSCVVKVTKFMTTFTLYCTWIAIN